MTACRQAAEPQILRLATTTSTADSGLLETILPDFEAQFNAQVNVIAVGTGQAIELGEAGDVDVILVHARAREDEFVNNGHGLYRVDVMYNDFVLVGPADDPAGIHELPLAQEALAAIATTQATFASRGDDSGTHTKENSLWGKAGITPDPTTNSWYKSLGQGMGETLLFANEQQAYTLTDRGTYLAMRDQLPNLVILVGGNAITKNSDPAMLNPYGVIPVNPDKEGIQAELAEQFVTWLTTLETQQKIATFGLDSFGQPLFYANSEAWQQQQN